MTALSIASLLSEGLVERVVGEASVVVRDIKHDSRRVEPGDMFAALPGVTRDGGDFAKDAIARGAVAVLAERELSVSVPVAVAGDSLRALSAIAQRLHDDPTAQLEVVGITGTNGKTTTAYLVEQMLLAAGKPTAMIGTVEVHGPGGVLPATHTTPMADDLMRLCRWAVGSGATHLVLEVSSHGLAMHRSDGVHYAVAAFTNLSQDHLDYHGDLESYGRAKRRLFSELSPRKAVINVDDSFGAQLAAEFSAPLLTCSKDAGAQRTSRAGDRVPVEVRALSFRCDLAGIDAQVATPQGEFRLHSPLVGEHNLDNLLLSLGIGLSLDLAPSTLVSALSSARGAPGRLERVDAQGFSVFVDYAHTPDALERVLAALRPHCKGRLLLVFGCGGDRDRKKRAPMGAAAARYADIAILTSDNPRSENPERILDDVEDALRKSSLPERTMTTRIQLGQGKGYVRCADRRRAIGLAIELACAGDCVLIAGKGHEKVQILGDRREPFDDCEEARRFLREREGTR